MRSIEGNEIASFGKNLDNESNVAVEKGKKFCVANITELQH